MLQALDVFYTLLHLVIIIFNLTGWIWKKSRRIHFYVILLTAFSWFVLGIWYGFGYCPVTDWQWEVKEKMGEENLPASFVKYFADAIFGTNINSNVIDILTVVCFFGAAFLSVHVNFSNQKRKLT